MNREEIFYLIPYLFSLALSLGVFAYTWRHRDVRGARVYSWFVFGQTITIIGFILELTSPNIETKLLWDKFQWLSDSFLIIIPFLVFTLQYSEYKLRRPRLTWGYWIGLPLLFTLFLLTDNIHHLAYPNPHLSADLPFPDLQYDFTTAIYTYVLLYVYGANLFGLSLLVRRAVEPYNPYRLQYWTIIIGFLIPLFSTVLALLGIKVAPQRDITPFSLAIGNLVVAWGLFRYGLFDIVPIAREHIVENVSDPIVVLDVNNRVVDINPAALKMLEKTSAEALRRPFKEVFAELPDIVGGLENIDVGQKEVPVRDGEDTFFYDLNISSIRDKRDQLIGRIIIARDVTRHKTLEAGYRTLSTELEQRVIERTEELRQTAERYRAVVENQTEFIVRWKPDGTRTFVNEAYCRYWDLTVEDALAVNFFAHIAEEDRPAVKEKVSRLITGTASSETETHRIVKPDGSIAWQEWTDQVIRNEAGNVVELLSVGRDITKRKQAEEALRLSEERYRRLAENAPDIIFRYRLSPEPKLEYINSAVERITGYSPEECYADPLLMLNMAHPQDAHIMAELMQSLDPSSEPIVMRWVGKDGAVRWMESRLLPVYDETGHLVAVEGLTRNITEGKQAEDALRESENLFRKMNENSPLGMHFYKMDNNNQLVFVGANPAADKLLGVDNSQFIGKTIEEAFPPLMQTEVPERYRDAAAKGIPWETEQIAYEDGKIRGAFEVRAFQTAPGNMVAVFADITERKQAEEALRKSEERFSIAFRASPVIVVIAQISNARILDVNETFEKITGYRREEAIGKNTLDLGLWANPLDRGSLLSNLFASRELRNEEFQFRIKNGNVLTCLLSAELIELGGENCVLATIEDISERKLAAEKLAEAYDTTLEGWAKALELRDKETEGHSRRVTETTVAVARAMGVSEDEVDHIRRGAILHDIGKMGIPDEILRKRGPLTDSERTVVVKHPVTAYNLLKPIAYLEKALDIPYCHHEKWDGSGYPRGLKGEEIPLAARIFAIVDVCDALSSDRPYREAWSQEKVAKYIIDESGKHFDPMVVSKFLEMMEKGGI